MMEGNLNLGSKDSQLPEYFNFADVIDKQAREEKVNRYNCDKKMLISASGKQCAYFCA